MKKTTLSLFVAFLSLTVALNTGIAGAPKKASTPAPTPDPTKKAQVQKILQILSPVIPNITAEDICATSAKDLEMQYVDALCRKGKTLLEANDEAAKVRWEH